MSAELSADPYGPVTLLVTLALWFTLCEVHPKRLANVAINIKDFHLKVVKSKGMLSVIVGTYPHITYDQLYLILIIMNLVWALYA